jgi:hypothetical protein
MMEQDAKADGTPLYWTGELPSLIANNEKSAAESTDEDELVTVGSPLDALILGVTRI